MKEMKTPLLATYSNGNTKIFITKDGTRVIKWPDDEEMKMDFPVSMDFKITNWCNENCPMCHEMSNSNGKHGNIMELEFINHLHKGTEIAIGGGKVTSHPDLVPFLKKLKGLGVLPSITVHQNEFFFNQDLIDELIKEKLIYGLGVSFSHQDLRIWEKVFSYPNAVAHVIAGYHDLNVFEFLKKYDHAKVLILGYKNWGRGTIDDIDFEKKYKPSIDALASKLKEYINDFDVVSFDNLAIEQLHVKDILTEKEWEDFYQGDDGTMTMYVDGVKEQFAKTSTSATRYGLKDTIEDMFKVIKEGA